MRKQDIYQLIGSLSATEKKVFKEKYAGKGELNFIRLFDCIAKGEACNDEEVREVFAGGNFLKHLHKTKAYLYDALLDTLLTPLNESYQRLQIFRKLQFAEVLQSRKLMEQAEATLLDALEMAKETDELELELFILNELLVLQSFLHKKQTYLTDLNDAQQKIAEYIKYRDFFVAVLDAYNNRGKKSEKSAEQFSNHPFLTSAPEFKAARGKRVFEAAKGLVYTVQKKYDIALQSNYSVVGLLKGGAHASSSRELGFINSVFNIYLAQRDLHISYAEPLKMLEDFKPHSRLAKSQRFVCLSRIKLQNYLDEKESGKHSALVDWVVKELKENASLLNELDLVKLWFALASVLLKAKDYNNALDYLFQINNSKEAKENRTIIYRVTQLYQLIAYYELGEFERLANALRNYKYYQKTDDSFYLIEKETAAFLGKVLNVPDKKQRGKLKEEFAAQLYDSAKNDLRAGLAYLESISWVKRLPVLNA